jgi:hypothetical protein
MKEEGAFCNDCGWIGDQVELQSDENLNELCPVCGSPDTWWGTPDWLEEDDG